MKRIKSTIAETPLERVVVRILNRHADGYEDISGVFEDLMHSGCQSGIIRELVYYSDTIKFYKKHQEEIDKMLQEICEDTGNRPDELFGDKWEKDDPLARGDLNQNLLAWFGFEETARFIAERIGIEV